MQVAAPERSELAEMVFGRLGLHSFPFHDPIILGTFIATVILGVALLAWVTKQRLWGYLWTEWFCSIDHKKIGIMYIVLALVMLCRGFADAIMMRAHQAVAFGDSTGFLPPHHYDQIFTAHGVIMIFFVAMPLISGLMNIVVPLQIGARDVAFPFLNNFALWLSTAGAVLVMASLFVGEFSTAGWMGYPPLSGLEGSPGVGVDYYIWALQISGVGTLLTGINFLVTIVKMRAPGMTWMRLPVFTWTTVATSILIVAAFPVLTAALVLLTMDRYADTAFFLAEAGGNAMFYINVIWIWGHPEVYILILPMFGVFSEVVPTFSRKPIFGYTSMVYATMAIVILSYIVWLHHFFTMGSGPSVNAFFGLATMIIAIPTGAKLFNWLFTMYKGRIKMSLPMMWTLAFMVTFTVGGMTGVMLAIPPVDFMLHNSLFLIAHFHNVIIGGVVFGFFAGLNYWFPKAMGFKLDEFWGKVSFWGWVIGYWLAFTPLYVLGMMGVSRRMSQFDDPSLQIWFQIAALGAVFVAIGILALFIQIGVSIKNREKLRDVTGDPWGGRSLEWATSSPPPAYNFAFTPIVHARDAWWDMKKRGAERPTTGFKPIHMPKGTSAGMVLSGLGTIFCFAMIWHIWWLAVVSLAGTIGYAIFHTFNRDRDYYIPADEVQKVEDERTALLASAAAKE